MENSLLYKKNAVNFFKRLKVEIMKYYSESNFIWWDKTKHRDAAIDFMSIDNASV